MFLTGASSCPFCNSKIVFGLNDDTGEVIPAEVCCHFKDALVTIDGKVKANFTAVLAVYVDVD